MERLIDKNWPLWMELAVQSIYAWRGPEADMYAQSLTQAVPANAALAFLTAAWEWNVTDLLPLVKCPTLVVHRRDQAFFPMRLGMAIAGGIRGARLQIVEGASSFPWVGERETCARIIDEFLADEGAEPRASRRRGASGGRVLATVLFTDIVSSTQRAAELGDRRWQALLRAHDELTRRELARFGGQSVKSVGDGFLATFERPERGVRCATSITEGVADLDFRFGPAYIRAKSKPRAMTFTGSASTSARGSRRWPLPARFLSQRRWPSSSRVPESALPSVGSMSSRASLDDGYCWL